MSGVCRREQARVLTSGQRPGGTIPAPSRGANSGQGLVLGSRKPSTVNGPAYFFFHLEETETEGDCSPVSAASCLPGSHVCRWAASCLVQQAARLTPRPCDPPGLRAKQHHGSLRISSGGGFASSFANMFFFLYVLLPFYKRF